MGKFREITPAAYHCGVGTCPSVFRMGDMLYVIGSSVPDEQVPDEIRKKIGEGETLISVPIGLISELEPRDLD